jgi:rSAM/selenodomain-associated transferase 1
MKHDNTGCVLFFVRYPEPGRVKTRLAEHMDPEFAAEIYRRFVVDLLATLQNLNVNLEIVFDPPEKLHQFQRWLGKEHAYFPQTGNNLGQRMKNAFQHIFTSHISKAVIIGSDIPDLPKEFLSLSFDALDTHDAAIGPSADGGYYLIGFSRKAFLPDAFENISWSSTDVFEQTVNILKLHKQRVYLLPQWYDVDTLADLKSLMSRNKNTNFERSDTFSFLKNAIWSASDV